MRQGFRRLVRVLRAPEGVARCMIAAACCAAMATGCAGGGEETDSALAPAAPLFTDVTEEAGLGAYRHENGGFGQKWMPEVVGPGGAFLDYDGDGWQDILLVGGGRWARVSDKPVEAVRLYRNLGDGTFDDVSAAAGLAGLEAYGFGVAAADYDNDGDTDFFLTALHENMLFRNEGGRFEEVGKEAGLADEAHWSASAVFFDADRDGWVDLFVGNYVSWTPETDIACFHEGTKAYCTPQNYAGVASAFYRNRGDGSFADATEEAGFAGAIDPALDKTLGVAELDVTGDGYPDVYVANDTERNLLFVNRGDGTFVEAGVRSGVAYDQHGQARAGMGVDAGVVDSTGETTIFVGNFTQETVSVFRHASNGYFTDRATASRIGFPTMGTLTFGLFLFDADLDGDLDLFLANGHVLEHIAEILEGATFAEPAQLFLNRGDGVFDEALSATGVLARPLVARGAAYADYDRDGDLDILLLENAGPAHLWRNDLEGARWLSVQLEGRDSNRSALGARIEAVVGGLRMARHIRSGSSFLSQSALPAVFGLGARRQVDSLIVRWPSGLTERFADVEAGQEVTLVEGSGVLRRAEPALKHQ